MTLDKFLAKAKQQATPGQVTLLRRLYEWAHQEGFKIHWSPEWGTEYESWSFAPCLPEEGGKPRLFWARTYGHMTIPFDQLPEEPCMKELEAECRRRLERLGIELSAPKEPWFDVIRLGEKEIWDGFVRTMKWYAENYRKLKRQPAE